MLGMYSGGTAMAPHRNLDLESLFKPSRSLSSSNEEFRTSDLLSRDPVSVFESVVLLEL